MASSTTADSASATQTPSETTPGSATSSPESTGITVHTVKVGAGGFSYDPDVLEDVAVGDVVTFNFFPPDHSVARAEYKSACVPYENTNPGKEGFWSGVKYVDDAQNPTPWNLTINSTEPIFFYCTAPGSCIDHQMVGVINPNSTQTLETQQLAAKNADFMVAPGGQYPSEGGSSTSTPTATAAAGSSSSNSGHHISGGVIAGAVVGAIAFLAICAALFFFIGRTKSLKDAMSRKHGTVTNTTEKGPDYSTVGGASYPPPPFSPDAQHGDSRYSMFSAVENGSQGWVSPPPQHSHSPHVSMMAPLGVSEAKPQQPVSTAAEMPSPGLPSYHDQQAFSAELEAPLKTPRG